MKIIVRGYGDGKLVLEERLEVAAPENIWQAADEHSDQLGAYELSMVEIEFPDEPDPFRRFMCFERQAPGKVLPGGFRLPSHCEDCGTVLMGGATVHEPGCSFQAIVDKHFGGRPS